MIATSAASELVLAEGDQLCDVAGLAGARDGPAAEEVVLAADGPADRGQKVTAAAHDTPTCRTAGGRGCVSWVTGLDIGATLLGVTYLRHIGCYISIVLRFLR